jgi:hypothetical protein
LMSEQAFTANLAAPIAIETVTGSTIFLLLTFLSGHVLKPFLLSTKDPKLPGPYLELRLHHQYGC